jgi:hypothetical protein
LIGVTASLVSLVSLSLPPSRLSLSLSLSLFLSLSHSLSLSLSLSRFFLPPPSLVCVACG